MAELPVTREGFCSDYTNPYTFLGAVVGICHLLSA